MIFLLNEEKNEKLLKILAKTATKLYKLPKKSYIEFSFITKEEIQQINREARGVDAVTDVLSFPSLDGIFGKRIKLRDFPFDIDPENGMLNLGSILVCMDKVMEQANEYGTGEVREFSYLVTHGIHHLLGYDHIEESDKAVMRMGEEKLLSLINFEKSGIKEIEK